MDSSSSVSAPNIIIPTLTKTEVKIEAEDVRLPPSTLYLNTPKPQSQSTLPTSFPAHFPPLLPASKKSEQNLTHFTLAINDPFTIKAFAYFQAAFAEYLKESLISELMSQNKSIITRIVVNKGTPVPVKDNKESQSVKKEEETTCQNSEAGKTNKPPANMPKKKAQNRIKNIPGLIMQRVRSGIKSYFARSPKFPAKDKRLVYIEKVLDNISKQDKERLAAFLETYQKNWKTWNTIQQYLHSDPRMGGIMLDTVMGFFQEDGLEDFNDWLTSGKMSDKSKAAVLELKERIGQKFSKLLVRAEGDEEIEELKSDEKLVKKEDI